MAADTNYGGNVINGGGGSFQITAPALVLNGQPVTSGINFNMNLGASVSDMAAQSYNFLQTSNNQNQAFLNQNIQSTYGFTQYNVGKTMDLYGRIVDTQNYAVQRATKNKRGCFITTAVCEADGKPDDCHELTVLRRLRDDIMLPCPDMNGLVKQYYDIAPEIVERLAGFSEEKRSEVLAVIRDDYIVPAVHMCERGDFHHAVMLYSAMVTYAIKAVVHGR